MNEFSDLSQLALNVRWILKSDDDRPDRWATELVRRTRKTINHSRAHSLLDGTEPSQSEMQVLVDVTGYDREELVTVPLYTRDHLLLTLNLRHLVASIPHGQGKEAAQKIGVTDGQLSRWKRWGDQKKPHRINLRNLLKFHGMDPDLDLEEVPVFLSMEPLSGYAQKEWIFSRVNDLPASEIAKIYPALKKLLRYDEKG